MYRRPGRSGRPSTPRTRAGGAAGGLAGSDRRRAISPPGAPPASPAATPATSAARPVRPPRRCRWSPRGFGRGRGPDIPLEPSSAAHDQEEESVERGWGSGRSGGGSGVLVVVARRLTSALPGPLKRPAGGEGGSCGAARPVAPGVAADVAPGRCAGGGVGGCGARRRAVPSSLLSAPFGRGRGADIPLEHPARLARREVKEQERRTRQAGAGALPGARRPGPPRRTGR